MHTNFFVIALLCGLSLQLASCTRLTDKCAKTDVDGCTREVGQLLDRDFKIAHLTAVRGIARRYIDVCRNLIEKYQDQDHEYTDNLRKIVRELKTEIEGTLEKFDDKQELQKIVQKILHEVRKDQLRSRQAGTVNDEQITKALEENEFRRNVADMLRVLIEETAWTLREISEELKEKNIQLTNDLNQRIDELVNDTRNAKDDDERLKMFIENGRKLTETIDAPYAKGVELERIDRLRKL